MPIHHFLISHRVKIIYKKLQQKNVAFRHVCEVGVYLPETSNVIDFIKNGVKASLVEADPVIVSRIRALFKDYNVQVYPFAVWDYTGTIKLSKASASTFVTELQASPALVNDKYVVREEDTFEVPCKVFSEVDDGSIDLLSIDIEGSEWYVLKHLVSSPKVISVETHGKVYTNPFLKEILAWMAAHRYQAWYKDSSDTVFVKEGAFEITPVEKLKLKLAGLRIRLRRARKSLLAGKIGA